MRTLYTWNLYPWNSICKATTYDALTYTVPCRITRAGKVRNGLVAFAVVALVLLLGCSLSIANDIEVTQVRLVDQNTEAGENHAENFTYVEFDIAWENSWRLDVHSGINNHDAAWVFVKFREDPLLGGDGLWRHAQLHTTGHGAGFWQGDGDPGAVIETEPAGLRNPAEDFDEENPVLGAFVYREHPGRGLFKAGGVRLRWNYGGQGIADNAIVDIQVFAIEMVYVPQGGFFVGDGTPSNGTLRGQFHKGGDSTVPFRVTSEDELTLGGEQADALANNNASGMQTPDDFNIGATQSLSDNFPKGYKGFYVMKYPVSQQQYVDFLNTLTYTQQLARTGLAPDENAGTFIRNAGRHRISIETPGKDSEIPAVFSTEHPFVANNFMSWQDGAAFADWAALRPMTELEFEKVARGPVEAVVGEFAWGTATIHPDRYSLQNPGDKNEFISSDIGTQAGNANYAATHPLSEEGPLRAGIFATQTSNREQSGGSYWGVLQLSGNLWEQTVTVGNQAGRSFSGLHGDGALSDQGYANTVDWPGSDHSEHGGVTGAAGSGYRGGAWDSQAELLRIADRTRAVHTHEERRDNSGFRAARSSGCEPGIFDAPDGFRTDSGLSPGQAEQFSLVTYEVDDESAEHTHYLWVVPGGWTIVAGQGTNILKVLTGANSGIVRVAPVNPCGSGQEVFIKTEIIEPEED